MIYPFRCSDCGLDVDLPVHDPEKPSPCCGAPLRRVWHRIGVRRSMAGHWNNAVGAYVSNEREFSDALRRQSDGMSERLGMDVNYQPVDWADAKDAGGITEEGLDETRRAQHDRAKS